MKSIEHNFIRIIKVSVFQAKGSSTVGKAWDCTEEVSTTVPGSRVQVRGSFFAEIILLQNNSGIDARMIYFRETSIAMTTL